MKKCQILQNSDFQKNKNRKQQQNLIISLSMRLYAPKKYFWVGGCAKSLIKARPETLILGIIVYLQKTI